jgi:hypothetical protein
VVGTNFAARLHEARQRWRTPLTLTVSVRFSSEINMTDKARHRHRPTPHGYLPNWALAVLVGLAIALVGLARSLV